MNKTLAEKFMNTEIFFDGIYSTEEGVTYLKENAKEIIYHETDNLVQKFILEDDSIITMSHDVYEVGFLECFCWRAAGHTDTCEYEEENIHQEGRNPPLRNLTKKEGLR